MKKKEDLTQEELDIVEDSVEWDDLSKWEFSLDFLKTVDDSFLDSECGNRQDTWKFVDGPFLDFFDSYCSVFIPRKGQSDLVYYFYEDQTLYHCLKNRRNYFDGLGDPDDKETLPATETQVGGTHYKDLAIQPTFFSQKNQLNTCEANVVKYVCRHRQKGGKEDIKKAIHYLQLLLEIEYSDE